MLLCVHQVCIMVPDFCWLVAGIHVLENGLFCQFSRFLQDGKEEVRRGNGSAALGALQRAFDLSKEIADLRAERSAVRVQARAYRYAVTGKRYAHPVLHAMY